MITKVLFNYVEVKPVENNAQWWLSLLSGNPRRYSVNGNNGYHAVNGTNGTAPVQPGRTEPFPQYWLRLLSGGQNYNGNGHSPVSTPLPAIDLDAEHWLKILAGK
ncbi:MAG: hypothetical protein KDI62_14600 [Anaerolineae bacterium]|nr:hypothetical protein [Anaerolineae bacterium]MCB0179458.1 hypothetical protein [Anaerolineae bacterium]MCB9102955.1 hypothetical protein [Anaerolineales bacterium]